MSRVDVATLRLRVPAGQAARAQARTEDALRLAAPDDERLLVLRRLDLGRMPAEASPAQWARTAQTRMSALVGRAVHASSAAAAAAEAVWFASASEARILLLAELAAGRRPSAWYWRLAVPDWHDAPAAPTLATLLAQAQRAPQALVELARALVAVADLPLLRALSAWLPEAAPSTSGAAPVAAARHAPIERPHDIDFAAAAALHAQASLRLARLPARLRALLAQAAAEPVLAVAAVRLVVRLALVADAPELAAQAAHLEACVDAVIAALQTQARARESQAPQPPGPASPGSREPEPSGPPAARQRGGEPGPATPAGRAPAAPDATPAAPTLFTEHGSAAAGVWLLVRPLARMGLGEWLEASPALAAAGFGPALLRHVVERLRIAPDDPIFAFLEPPLAEFDGALLAAWRIGLDRWLRRRTRRRLVDVVQRRGWLSAHPSGLSVRFRVAQADIALRLLALDADPGWVPWLGRHVVYHYRDEAVR